MRKFITQLWLACAMAMTAVCLTTPLATAQTTVGNVGDTDLIGKWAEEFNARQIELGAFFEAPEFAVLMDSIGNDSDAKTLTSHRDAWLQNVENRMVEFRKNINAMAPPVLQSSEFKKLNKVFTAQYESLDVSLVDLETLIDDMNKLVTQLINGDDSELGQLEKIMFISSRKMIQGENAMMETSINLVNLKDHPSIPLLRMMIETNNVVMYELDISILAVDELTTLQDRKPMIEKMELSLMRAQKEKARAYRSSNKYKIQVDRAMALTKTSAEKQMLEQASNIYNSFETSIDNEGELLDLVRKQIDMYKAEDDYWVVEEQVDALDDQFFKLIDRRLVLQNDRAVFVQKMQ